RHWQVWHRTLELGSFSESIASRIISLVHYLHLIISLGYYQL
ncbi:unnamed protein product, partial [marine sediment metagenome]